MVGDEFDLVFNFIMLPHDLGHASFVAAQIVDENVSIVTFSTDISKGVDITSKDIYVALAVVKMVVGDTLLAGLTVETQFGATTHGYGVDSQCQAQESQHQDRGQIFAVVHDLYS